MVDIKLGPISDSVDIRIGVRRCFRVLLSCRIIVVSSVSGSPELWDVKIFARRPEP